ncbi:protein FAR1-RELATED SEQUENCE 5-like [Salvia miltiorrhiza]|uniref:protein FAR1-RELATED SEQUENCE 5-like n=1 Tax=Salvia miltiorrhiza TaxID=226208 RepID=UPI0025ACC01F|nr:protein FAR1-RELATED SEQUENCE 5-like [Salvia miltiorrhiza]
MESQDSKNLVFPHFVRDNFKELSVSSFYVNQEGVWEKLKAPVSRINDSTSKKRKTTSCKIDCKAKVIFKLAMGTCYKITEFVEGHTHTMVPIPARDLMQSNRNLDEFQQRFILSGIKANIGPMRSFRMFREIMGSYEGIGCTGTDFKNFVRDLKVHSKGSDAHMLLETFTNRQELGNGFKSFHDVDEDNKLCRIIWANEMSVKNFSLFGDAVSFDATYNRNRYKLIFTPFTGKDNHGKCVSFGAALISHEDTESYAWVLDRFDKIMGNAPRILITNQDPGLKKAVASCWKETHHRFCMWHKNIKVAEKLPPRLRENTAFKTTYDNIVWTDDDDADVFEEKWNNMIQEFELSSNKWFTDMFEERSMWIPAGVDAQRYNYKLSTHNDETRSPTMVTNLPIERNTSVVYTNSVFKDVQDEIDHASKACGMHKMYSEGNITIYEVDDKLDGVFLVRHMKSEDEVICSCNLFVRKGTPCKHMFFVFRNLILTIFLKSTLLCGGANLAFYARMNHMINSVVAPNSRHQVSETIAHVRGHEELSEQLYNNLIELRDKFVENGATSTTACSKTRLFNKFYGSAPTDSPTVLPPDIAKTKGSGVGGRRRSEQEKAMILAQKT